MRVTTVFAMIAAAATLPLPAHAEGHAVEGNAAEGAAAFTGCVDCHDLRPGHHMTGPSLAGVFGAKAANKADFARYSEALKRSKLTWDAGTLDAYLADPRALVPGSRMNFALDDAKKRADIIAYLAATQRADGKNRALDLPKPAHASLNLKNARPTTLVATMQLCKDTYRLKMRSGATVKVWERDLRLKTDSSEDGPAPGAPALIQGGMHGDRPYVVFSAPGEISAFVKAGCGE